LERRFQNLGWIRNASSCLAAVPSPWIAFIKAIHNFFTMNWIQVDVTFLVGSLSITLQLCKSKLVIELRFFFHNLIPLLPNFYFGCSMWFCV
jgi:hypothetical protein